MKRSILIIENNRHSHSLCIVAALVCLAWAGSASAGWGHDKADTSNGLRKTAFRLPQEKGAWSVSPMGTLKTQVGKLGRYTAKQFAQLPSFHLLGSNRGFALKSLRAVPAQVAAHFVKSKATKVPVPFLEAVSAHSGYFAEVLNQKYKIPFWKAFVTLRYVLSRTKKEGLAALESSFTNVALTKLCDDGQIRNALKAEKHNILDYLTANGWAVGEYSFNATMNTPGPLSTNAVQALAKKVEPRKNTNRWLMQLLSQDKPTILEKVKNPKSLEDNMLRFATQSVHDAYAASKAGQVAQEVKKNKGRGVERLKDAELSDMGSLLALKKHFTPDRLALDTAQIKGVLAERMGGQNLLREVRTFLNNNPPSRRSSFAFREQAAVLGQELALSAKMAKYDPRNKNQFNSVSQTEYEAVRAELQKSGGMVY